MRGALQRMLAVVAMVVLAGTDVAMMAAWSPTTAGLISPASAQEEDDDDDGGDDDDGEGDDDDSGQVPAGGIATGHRGTATATGDDDDDDGDDGDSGQVPAGGIATGQGGTAESWTDEAASNERSTGTSVGWARPLAGLAVGGATVGRLAVARLAGRRG